MRFTKKQLRSLESLTQIPHVEEFKQLLRRQRKNAEPSVRLPNATERRAVQYIQLSRLEGRTGQEFGVPDVFYEAFEWRLGGLWYKPDFVAVWPGAIYREIFEVKGTTESWKGYRDREARVRLEFLRHVSQPFGWRVFLLEVSQAGIKEREIEP